VAAAAPVGSSPAPAGPVAAAVQNVSPSKVAHSVAQPQQHGKPPTHPPAAPRKTVEAEEEDLDEDEDLFQMDEVGYWG
jgi:hypothetical protein